MDASDALLAVLVALLILVAICWGDARAVDAGVALSDAGVLLDPIEVKPPSPSKEQVLRDIEAMRQRLKGCAPSPARSFSAQVVRRSDPRRS